MRQRYAWLLLLVGGWTAMPVPVTTTADVIRIGTLPGLRFDTSAFSVRPGTDVELVFSNYDEMLHNFVITRPGGRERVVQAAVALGAGAAERAFVPPSPDVLWASKVVASGDSFSLKFTAPTALGDYPYVCTIPSHGITMFGTMTVTNTPRPAVMTPVDAPAPTSATHTNHSGTPASRGTVQRGFMPDSGPASIAVELPGGVSYVWDAGAGRFRYAWTGGYMTMPASPERGLARLTGEVFYREAAFPLRFGATPSTPPKAIDFRGYTLDATGIPEFEIVADGVTVRERAEVASSRLVRRFRVTGSSTVWFAAPEGVLGFEAAGGVRQGQFYRFTGAAAQDFTVAFVIPAVTTAPPPTR